MSAFGAARRFAAECRRRGTPVTVAWTETVGGTVAADTKAVTGGTTTPKSLGFPAFVHSPDYSDWRVRKYAEVETGELFLDFIPGALAALTSPAAGVTVANVVFTVRDPLTQEAKTYTVRRNTQGLSVVADAIQSVNPVAHTLRLVLKP